MLRRAYEIADQLTQNDISQTQKPIHHTQKNETPGQFCLFGSSGYEDVIEALKAVDITKMTPLDALNKLYSLQELVK